MITKFINQSVEHDISCRNGTSSHAPYMMYFAKNKYNLYAENYQWFILWCLINSWYMLWSIIYKWEVNNMESVSYSLWVVTSSVIKTSKPEKILCYILLLPSRQIDPKFHITKLDAMDESNSVRFGLNLCFEDYPISSLLSRNIS